MEDWSELHGDMLALIGECLTHVHDHLSFSMVCSSWRLAALVVRPHLPLSVPLLMLPRNANLNSQTRCYFSFSDQSIIEKKSFFPFEDFCAGSHGGWLVMVHKNLNMSLYNPFSEEMLPLPPVTSIPKIEESSTVVENDIFIETACLSSSDNRVSPKNLTVMIAHGGCRRLAFANPGDTHWQIIDNDLYLFYSAIAFYEGKFYAAGDQGTVVCDLGPNPKATLVAPGVPTDGLDDRVRCYKWYLVESLGELILVARWFHTHNDNNVDEDDITFDFVVAGQKTLGRDQLGDRHRNYRTVFFSVYKLDCSRRIWMQVKDLSNQVFFLGHNTSFSLSSLQYEEWKGNFIYFTEDYLEGKCWAIEYDLYHGYDMGVFDKFKTPVGRWLQCLPSYTNIGYSSSLVAWEKNGFCCNSFALLLN